MTGVTGLKTRDDTGEMVDVTDWEFGADIRDMPLFVDMAVLYAGFDEIMASPQPRTTLKQHLKDCFGWLWC